MNPKSSGKIIFVTGTDTGVGKTLLTALLLRHLREKGIHALAMKPFCSGGRADVEFLQSLQPAQLTDDQMNPFYYPEAVTPLVSQKKRGKKVGLKAVIRRIREVEMVCERLIIEGSGGLLVPLGEAFTVLDLITELHCEVIVVGRNKLGTINHTLLTVKALELKKLRRVSVVLMDQSKGDDSAATNQKIIGGFLRMSILRIPFLGNDYRCFITQSDNHKKVEKILARILG